MKASFLKELKFAFCSSSSFFFSLSFLLVTGVLLWGFSGSYNLLDSGYIETSRFFSLSSLLLLILIPALTMRQFSEEKRNKTFDILRARPINILAIYFSKFFSTFLFVAVVILPTVIYFFSLHQLAYPIGNIDIPNIVASYISLLLLATVFISIGLFASSVTRNQVVAFIIAISINAFAFYGFELFAKLFLSGKMQVMIASFGLFHHYDMMQRGVIKTNSLLVIFNYLFIFTTICLLSLNNKRRYFIWRIATLALINILFLFIPNTRFDFTADKRYTINDYSKKLLTDISEKQQSLHIDVWLAGDLNAGFTHLRNAVDELLKDFNSYAGNNITVEYRNPYLWHKSLPQMYESMSGKGMNGIVLNEVDHEGKSSQKIIYPYAEVTNGKDTLAVSFLKNIKGYTANENLNASIENLEFEFIDAIRLLNQQEPKNIAFIEGHGELPRAYVYDAEELLSKYYFVNRGEIGSQTGVLDNFDVVIIAGPLQKYTEAEKYILDQYIMSGGKVLWIVDGAYYSHEDLTREGYSASIKNDTNLDDLLFTYGVRINADFVQDKQCASIYLVSDDEMQSSVTLPCYYMPLLMPSHDHLITKDIRDVKAAFAASIDIVNNSPDIKRSVLLTTSANSHIVKVPEKIDLDIEDIQNRNDYFDQSYIPVALSLEGEFHSAFANRMTPDGIISENHKTIAKSNKTRMVVISSSDIIRNEIEGRGENSNVLPMGFDRVSNQQLGNREFIVNAVNWLTDNDGWMKLRSKKQQMYILDRDAVYAGKDMYAILNIGIPILFIAAIMGGVFFYRKRKYGKDSHYKKR